MPSRMRDEATHSMPDDAVVLNPMAQVAAGIAISAPVERVWPWIVQIGSGRAGWYSYDWIDNGGHPSASSILPQHQRLEPGQVVPAIPGFTDAFIVAAVEPPTRLVLIVPDVLGGSQVRYESLLEPLTPDRTRLTVRGVLSERWPSRTKSGTTSAQQPFLIERIYGLLARTPRPIKLGLAYVGHHFMESRMLRGIKRRAEAS